METKILKDGRYEMWLQKTLGRGSFGDVYLALDRETSKEVAIKVISMEKIRKYKERLVKATENEIAVMRDLTKHENPYLLRYIDCFDTANNKYLVVDYCNGGTLGDMLKEKGTLPETQCLEYAYQMVLGLSAVEESNFSHRDLKPDNVFMHDGYCKIGDFGFATNQSKFQSSLGTCMFMAPEFYSGGNSMNTKVDVWAFGVSVYQMLFGDYPFDGNHVGDVINNVQNKPLQFPPQPRVNQNIQDMLRRTMEKDPQDRISFKELRNHPAFESVSQNTIQRLGQKVQIGWFGTGKSVYVPQNNQAPQVPASSEKNSKICTTLVNYRNSYMFYFEMAQNLELVDQAELTSFFIAKKAVQRASRLLFYLKFESQPPPDILPNVNQHEWVNFIQANLFDNFLQYLVSDTVELRVYFEKRLAAVSPLIETSNNSYTLWLNDDLQADATPAFRMFVIDCIQRIFRLKTSATLDMALRMTLMLKIDASDSSSPFIDNISDKLTKAMEVSMEQKESIINQFLTQVAG